MSAIDYFPKRIQLATLRRAAAKCEGCELYKNATQTVFGEGVASAELFLIGEQPDDEEDRRGRPFVGPAGKLLDEALRRAGIARERIYITNAVKHFRFEERGKRRLHKKPSARHIAACRPWLEAELTEVKPSGVVCLGATAAQTILGTAFRITRERGKFLRSDVAEWTMATYHPSAVLRAPDSATRRRMLEEFQSDLDAVGLHPNGNRSLVK